MTKRKFKRNDRVSFLSYGQKVTGKISHNMPGANNLYSVMYDTGGSTTVREDNLTLVDMADAVRADDIVKAYDRIQKLRDSITAEFHRLTDLMIDDKQPAHELRKLDEIRVLVVKSGHKDLVAEWMAWSGYAVERKRK